MADLQELSGKDAASDRWTSGVQVTLNDGRGVVIVRPTSDHAGDLARVRSAVIAEGKYTLATPAESSPDRESEMARLERFRTHPGSIYLACLLDNCPIGLIEFQNGEFRRTQHWGQLTIFVDKRYRGLGAGEALLRSLLDWATDSSIIEKVALAVFSSNARAIKLYEKLGFKREGYCPRDMRMEDGRYVDSVLMYRFVDQGPPRSNDNQP